MQMGIAHGSKSPVSLLLTEKDKDRREKVQKRSQ